MQVKVLSIQNPWASLVLKGLKSIELRTWRTRFRGIFYIHVTRQKPGSPPSTRALEEINQFPVGSICGRATLTDVKRYGTRFELHQDLYEHLVDCVDYNYPLYGWRLVNIEILEKPIPAKGRLGFWRYELENP